MTNTTTQHIKALLVNDGREFAMVRKADLAALLEASGGTVDGRYVDLLGRKMRKIDDLKSALQFAKGEARAYLESAQKHGEERRRYMANNRALLSRVDQLEAQADGIRADKDHICSSLLVSIDESARFEAGLLRVARFKRKFPALGALMDLTP